MSRLLRVLRTASVAPAVADRVSLAAALAAVLVTAVAAAAGHVQ